MGLYRDENGLVFEVDDSFAATHGYTPVSPEEDQYRLNADAMKERGEQSGALGAANASLTGIASGMTLGGSDYLLGELATPLERQQIQADLENHPYFRTGGEIGGQVASMFAGGGRVTPTGYLSNLAAQETERGLVQGGIKGTAKALGAMGAEGALNNAGAYLGHAALADKEVTVEGMAGALGTGFAFGAVGGGAVLGVSKGTIAARRMFSRFADEGGEKAAESAWTLASQEALEADTATAEIAKKRLADMNTAKAEALKYKQQADSVLESEKIRAMTHEAETPIDPDAALMEPAKGGQQTAVFQRPKAAEPFEGPVPLDEGITPATGGQQTSVSKHVFGNEETKVIPRERVPESGTAVPKEGTELEGQLAATKAEIDGGKSLKEIKASKGNDSNAIESMLAEKKAFDSGEAGQRTAVLNMGPRRDMRQMMSLRKQLGKQLLGEMREAHTAELLGKPLAKEESTLSSTLKEFEEAKADLEKHVLPSAEFNAGAKTVPGTPKSVQLVDEAYERALDQARLAADPVARGHALQTADDLEQMLTTLTHEGVRTPGAAQHDMERAIEVLQRYEKASAKLTEAVGDGAHPTAVIKAKALKDAERESERKVSERTVRATDDAATYGPEYLDPKGRIAHARQMRLDAKNALNEAKTNVAGAKEEYAAARDRVAAGERAKKGALKLDARNAREAARASARAEKAAAAGGFLEMLDVPGLPKPSDLPVVGPLLGAYLKYRAVKTALGRFGLRVPASADARVAALASKTRDRVARAVDRSIGLAHRAAPVARKAMPQLTATVSRRLFDDGGEHPPAHAPIQEHVAARARELAAYVTTPGAIEKDVRLALRDVTDPDIIAAAEKQRRVAMQYLLDNAPKMPEQGPLQRMKWLPSGAQAMSFARRMEAVDDPAGVYERLANERDMISLEAADALRAVYPQLFTQAQQRLLERSAEIQAQVPARQRVQLSLLFKMPLDAGLAPDNLKISQSVFERKPPAPVSPVSATPTPAIASDTNLTALYQTTSDRRAMR